MKNKGMYGLNQVVYKVIRDYMRCRDSEIKNSTK